MGKLHFCANISWLFKEVPLLERYQLAADAGFEAVEVAWPYEYALEDLIQAKEAAKVKQILLNTGCSETLGSAADFSSPQTFRDELDKALHYANGLNCKNIHIMAGKFGKDHNKHRALESYVENLKYAGDKLQSHGKIGLIEPISAPNYFLNTSVEALDILKLVERPNMLYQLDFFHLQVMEGNLTRKIKDNLSKIGHIQVSQVPGRNELSCPGEIQYQYILSLLEDLGYDGWIGCEYNPSKSMTESLQWFRNYMSNDTIVL